MNRRTFLQTPVAGGREHLTKDDALELGAVSDTTNQFQARYAIRHLWEGPITCSHPERGVWGGPPGGPKPRAIAATSLAAAPRNVQFQQYAASRIAELGVGGKLPGATPEAGGTGWMKYFVYGVLLGGLPLLIIAWRTKK